MGIAFSVIRRKKKITLKNKNFKGRCEKRTFGKCKEVCKTYNPIQAAYAEMLQEDITIEKFNCNVPLDGLEIGDYTSDFVCTRTNGEIIVPQALAKAKDTDFARRIKRVLAEPRYFRLRGGYRCGIGS